MNPVANSYNWSLLPTLIESDAFADIHNEIAMFTRYMPQVLTEIVISYFPSQPSDNLDENIDNCITYLLLSHCKRRGRFDGDELKCIAFVFKSSIKGCRELDKLFQSFNPTKLLSRAVQKGNSNAVLSLVEENAEINSTEHSESLLHVSLTASLKLQLPMVQTLISLGADPFALNSDNQTPADAAHLDAGIMVRNFSTKSEVAASLNNYETKFIYSTIMCLHNLNITKTLINIITDYLKNDNIENAKKLKNWTIISLSIKPQGGPVLCSIPHIRITPIPLELDEEESKDNSECTYLGKKTH